MSIESVREAVRIRLTQKQKTEDTTAVMSAINTSLQSYPELTELEKDYAFRSCLENRTISQWADYYNVGYNTIQRMMNRPKVKLLKSEIQFDIRKFVVGMQLYLLRSAMNQYLKLFAIRETGENVETKRKAAKDVLSTFNLAVDPDSGGKGQSATVNIFNDTPKLNEQRNESDLVNVTEDVSLEVIEKEMSELKQLSVIKNAVEVYGKINKKSEKINMSFNDGEVKEIEVE